MAYKVVLVHSDEGYTAFCPELPGCIAEGDSADEAMANLREAVPEYLAVVSTMPGDLRSIEGSFGH